MRLALLNANTTDALTARMVAAATALLPDGSTVDGMTAPFGAPYISSREASAVAAHAVAAMARTIADGGERPDAVLIACFGDPGLDAAREILDCPVIGMADASMHAATQLGPRVSIVTGGRAWGPMLREFVAGIGLAARLASVRCLDLTGADIAARPDAALGFVDTAARSAFDDDGADVVILGGAGLAGLAEGVRSRLGRPVICSLRAAVLQSEALARTVASSSVSSTNPGPARR
jgi:allantoin racemase